MRGLAESRTVRGKPRDKADLEGTPGMRGKMEAGVRPSGHRICRTHQPSQPAQSGHTRGVERVWGKRPGRVLRSFRCGTSVKMAEDRQTKRPASTAGLCLKRRCAMRSGFQLSRLGLVFGADVGLVARLPQRVEYAASQDRDGDAKREHGVDLDAQGHEEDLDAD